MGTKLFNDSARTLVNHINVDLNKQLIAEIGVGYLGVFVDVFDVVVAWNKAHARGNAETVLKAALTSLGAASSIPLLLKSSSAKYLELSVHRLANRQVASLGYLAARALANKLFILSSRAVALAHPLV